MVLWLQPYRVPRQLHPGEGVGPATAAAGGKSEEKMLNHLAHSQRPGQGPLRKPKETPRQKQRFLTSRNTRKRSQSYSGARKGSRERPETARVRGPQVSRIEAETSGPAKETVDEEDKEKNPKRPAW